MFSQEIADRICVQLAEGKSLRSICRGIGVPESTVRSWEDANPAFLAHSTRARAVGCHSIADECLEIADDASNDWMESYDKEGEAVGWKLNGDHVQRSKLRIETRMRLLGKWLPKVYGDKIEQTHEVGESITKIVREIVRPA